MLSTHPAAEFLFSATLDQKAPFNFTNLLPVVSETGLGQICFPALVAPADYAGKPGVIQVIQKGPDGILYQVSLQLEGRLCKCLNSQLAVRSSQLRFRRQQHRELQLHKCYRFNCHNHQSKQLRHQPILVGVRLCICHRLQRSFLQLIRLCCSHKCASPGTRTCCCCWYCHSILAVTNTKQYLDMGSRRRIRGFSMYHHKSCWTPQHRCV